MRTFYLGWRVAAASLGQFDARAVRATSDGRPGSEIWQTLSAEFPFSHPDEETLRREILETQPVIETRAAAKKALP
jgi:hypothetical protein